MAKNYKYFLWLVLGSILLALAYPGWIFDLGFLVWIGFIPIIYALNGLVSSGNSEKKGWLKKSFWLGFLAGLIFFLIIFRWMWSIYPLDTFDIENNLVSLLAVSGIYILSVAVMSLFWGLFGVAIGYWSSKKHRLLGWVFPAAAFGLLEYVRAYVFGLLWFGSGTLLGSHWTLGSPAYALAKNNLALDVSSYLGIYGVVFLIILVNTIIFRMVREKRAISTAKTLTVVAALILISVLPELLSEKTRDSDNSVSFAVIQTNQPTVISPSPQDMLVSFEEQLSSLNLVATEHPESEVIVFPEASDFFQNLSIFLTNDQVQNFFTNLFSDSRLIIAGGRVIDSGQAHSRVFALDTKGDIINFYDKRLLTPGGEFLPYPLKLIMGILSRDATASFSTLKELSVGEKNISTTNFNYKFNVSPIVCSEILSPGLVREATQNSNMIIGMASYGIFHENITIVRQNMAAASFRASENQKPVIVASNMGLSYAINSRGRVESMTPNSKAQILTGNIVLRDDKSWYNRLGDRPIFLAFLFMVTLFGLLTRSGREGGS